MEEKAAIHDIENTKEPRLYELGFLLVPLIPPEELEKEVQAVSDIVEKHGTLRSARPAKSQKLAYPMEHTYAGKKNYFEKAYFGSLIFEADGAEVEPLTNALKRHTQIIRFLVIGRTEEDLALEEERLKAQAVEGDKEKDVGDEVADSSNEAIDKAIDQLVTEDAK